MSFLFIFGLVCLTANPHAKFEVCIFSPSRDIRGSQNPKVGHVTRATPRFGHFYIFFGLVSLTFNPPAKFEVCIFSRSRDIRGSQNLTSRSRDQGHATFGHFFHFYRAAWNADAV